MDLIVPLTIVAGENPDNTIGELAPVELLSGMANEALLRMLALDVAVKFTVEPGHTEAEDTEAAGTGNAFIAADVVAVAEHPLAVTVTVQVPVCFPAKEVIDGFCDEELKLFGPLQE